VNVAHGDEKYAPAFWQAKVDEARAMAENMTSEDGKRWMDEIVRLYERLAHRAEKREAAKRAEIQIRTLPTSLDS
jgi:hypothetical protein